ncbi:MAG: zf-HC2 domain-containing protein [Acidobacteriota bacterium]
MMDCSTFEEWIDLELEGALPAASRRGLDEHLATCGGCRATRREMLRLHSVLAESHVPVHADFTTAVMSSLPSAGWEGASVKAWRWPVALLVVLAIGASAIVGSSSARLAPDAPFLGAIAAIADLAQTSVLTGAGFLSASWQGLGLVVAEMLSTSKGNLLAFSGLVVAVNLFLFALLRRRPAPVAGHDSR